MILRFGSIVILWLVIMGVSHAAESTMPRQSDISNTLHNLSTTGSGTTKASSESQESQICVFCHTPHGANTAVTPLWNRDLSTETYGVYSSSSIQADIGPPGESSKLCLSCHDGTIAIGSLNVLAGQRGTVSMVGTNAGKMPDGTVANTGFTRNLGADLSNDHPISFSFEMAKGTTSTLTDVDVELRKPIDIVSGKHIAPLDDEDKVQCATCHDPHVSGQDLPSGTSLGGTTTANNVKFLRARRFQMEEPIADTSGVVADFNLDNDIVCLECHAKPGWASSVHAVRGVADEVYIDAAADLREFPQGITVWQAACLNCHDTHTVQGANRLLREGTTGALTGTMSTGGYRSGAGEPALENTCFQCHTSPSDSILTTGIANIEDEFAKLRSMPLNVYNGDKEVHDIQNADFTEGDVPAAGANDPNNAILGYGTGNLANRHAECTDCHNPHRMFRNSLVSSSSLTGLGAGDTTQGTHTHAAGTTHSNEISGVLYGTWGVEPVYSGSEFGPDSVPIDFTVKSGTGENRVKFEYQICLKCHSNYAYIDNGKPDQQQVVGTNSNGRPSLPDPGVGGLTPTALTINGTTSVVKLQTNSLVNYTNQAMEFYAPETHRGRPTKGAESGACVVCATPTNTNWFDGSNDFITNNQRSWHPVMGPTGRTSTIRSATEGAFRSPFNQNLGNQTMYCTDCHGAENGTATNSEPAAGTPWGPHGSDNNFLLRGEWERGSRKLSGNATLCMKCHTTTSSAFFHGGTHTDKVDTLDCMWCHVAIPHGWKNRGFLVNLNDIGPEVMCRSVDNSTDGYNVITPLGSNCKVGEQIPKGSVVLRNFRNGEIGYNNPPYYINARLRFIDFPSSGSSWRESNCGDKEAMTDELCDKGVGY